MKSQDSGALEPAWADIEERHIRPETLLADFRFGSTENLPKAAKLNSPLRIDHE
jgi:hypothetical protein